MSTDAEYFGSQVVKRFTPAAITSTTAVTIWTCPAGKRIALKGVALQARVSIVLAAATPGDVIALCDNAALASGFILPIGVIRTATDAAGTDYGFVFAEFTGGIPLTAAQNLRVGVGAAVGGTITVSGLVWGDEIL